MRGLAALGSTWTASISREPNSTTDRREEARHLGNLGALYFRLGQNRRALEYHEQDLTITRDTGDRRGEQQALGNIALHTYSWAKLVVPLNTVSRR
jgi:hypothetical protein